MDRKEWLEKLDEAGARLSQAAWELRHAEEKSLKDDEAAQVRFIDAITSVFLCCYGLHIPLTSKAYINCLRSKWRMNHE